MKSFRKALLAAVAILDTLIPPMGPQLAFAGVGTEESGVQPIDRATEKTWMEATVLTNAGRAILTNRIKAGGTEPLNIGWGTGAGTSAATDTTLFTEVDPGGNSTGSRTAGTSSQQTTTNTNDTYQVTGTVTNTKTAGQTITNAGLWDNATMGSGNLFLKGDFTGVALNNGDSIAFTFKLQFT